MPKIVRFHETGGPEVLKIEDLPLAQPGEGEVRLNVEAIGLSRAEVMLRQGRYLDAPELPSRLGYEAAGIVDAVGPGASDIHVGDRVSTIPAFSMGEHGVYGESAIVPSYELRRGRLPRQSIARRRRGDLDAIPNRFWSTDRYRSIERG